MFSRRTIRHWEDQVHQLCRKGTRLRTLTSLSYGCWKAQISRSKGTNTYRPTNSPLMRLWLRNVHQQPSSFSLPLVTTTYAMSFDTSIRGNTHFSTIRSIRSNIPMNFSMCLSRIPSSARLLVSGTAADARRPWLVVLGPCPPLLLPPSAPPLAVSARSWRFKDLFFIRSVAPSPQQKTTRAAFFSHLAKNKEKNTLKKLLSLDLDGGANFSWRERR